MPTDRTAVSPHLLVLGRGSGFVDHRLAAFVLSGLENGEGALLVLRVARAARVRALLAKGGIDVESAISEGKLVVLDGASFLARLQAGPMTADALARDLAEPLAKIRAATGVEHVCVFGDLADVLWHRGERALAIALECAWHGAFKRQTATLMCGYEVDPLDPSEDAPALLQLCRAHGHLSASENAATRGVAINDAINEVLGVRDAGMVGMLRAAAGIPSAAEGGEELTLLWLRTEVPHLAQRILVRARRALASGTDRNVTSG